MGMGMYVYMSICELKSRKYHTCVIMVLCICICTCFVRMSGGVGDTDMQSLLDGCSLHLTFGIEVESTGTWGAW